MQYPLNEPNQAKRAAICGAQLRQTPRHTLTEEEKLMFDAKFEEATREVTANAGRVLFAAVARVYSSLTWEERCKWSMSFQYPHRLVKTILVACADEVEDQFNAETIIPGVRVMKRIRKERCC